MRLRPPIRGDQTTESSIDEDDDDDGTERKDDEKSRPSAIFERCQVTVPSRGESSERTVILLHDISPTVPIGTADERARDNQRQSDSSITFL